MKRIFFLFLFACNYLNAQKTSLDSSFGVNGIARYLFDTLTTQKETGRRIFTQPDGKLIKVSVFPQYPSDIMVSRFFNDGNIDPSYGSNGTFILRNGTVHADYGIFGVNNGKINAAITSGGKILISYWGFTGSLQTDFYAVRINNNGTIDSLFGLNGTTLIHVRDSSENIPSNITADKNGRVIIIGTSAKVYYNDNDSIIRVDTSFALVRLNENGTPDAGFGDSGRIIIRPDSSYVNIGSDVAIQEDNKIVITGTSGYHKRLLWFNSDIVVIRFNEDGTPDSSFGNNGQKFIYYNDYSADAAAKITIQDDKKIVVAGITDAEGTSFVSRLLDDGSFDSSFNEDGKMVLDKIHNNDISFENTSLLLQAGGKILIAGELYNTESSTSTPYSFRLDETGNYDESYGESGIFTFSGIVIKSICPGKDEKIWALGNNNYLLRLNNNATFDSSFNEDGKMQYVVKSASNFFLDMQTLADGSTLVLGYDSLYPAFIKLKKDGSLDSSFNKTGKVILPVIHNNYLFTSLPNKKILLASSYYDLLRLNEDGNIDSTFGENGKMKLPEPGAFCNVIAAQPDGKIILAGNKTNINDTKKSGYYFIRLNTNGSYDTTFSANGHVVVRIAPDYGTDVTACEIQKDGKILASGNVLFNDTTFHADFSAVRLNVDGTLDNSFSNDGKFLLSTADYVQNPSMVISTDGSILLAGTVNNTSEEPVKYNFVKLKSNGDLDSSFNQNGQTSITAVAMNLLNDLSLDSKGKIIFYSSNNTPEAKDYSDLEFYLYRLNQDGKVDSTFGENGHFQTTTNEYIDIALGYGAGKIKLLDDGSILTANTSQVNIPVWGLQIIKVKPGETVLPITLVNISARLLNKDALISWQAANEISTSYFNVQRSLDGRNFYTVGKINATGNNTGSYSYKDLNVVAIGKQIIYYRLQQFDKNGSYSYSKIVSVTINENGKPQFIVYPNPAKQKLVVVPLNTSSQINKAQVSITDMSGKIVYTVSNVSITASGIEINVAMLAKGMYILTINSDDKITKLKFLKE